MAVAQFREEAACRERDFPATAKGFMKTHFLPWPAFARLAAGLMILVAASTHAQTPGALDISFNPGLGADSRVLAVARQADGRLVVAGQFNSFNGQKHNRVTRLNVDGTTDLTFDPGAGADSTVNAVAVQADGRIILGGDFYGSGTNAGTGGHCSHFELCAYGGRARGHGQ